MSAPVLVTGASTGIGRATVERLAGSGIPVLAGVRSASAAAALGALGGVEAITLDVTSTADLAALGERLEGSGLRGLVNNAGIAVPGPLEALPLDDLRRQFDVNVIAQVAVLQAALPALRLARGRIVNIGSVGGRVGQPYVGAYCGSKGALHLMSASLRRELMPWGIWVACVEPGAIDTEIWRKGQESADQVLDGLTPEGRVLYGARMAKMRAVVARQTRGATRPDVVAERIEHALTAPRPRAYYLVGRDALVFNTLQTVLPARAVDRLMSRALGL